MAPPAKTARGSRHAAYQHLRRQIVNLELAPGAALSENELAQDLGVSRTPVREAVILLGEEGLVQVFPRIGSFVSRVDLREVREAQFLRQAVELAALGEIPAAPDPAIVQQLQDNLQAQTAAGLSDEAFFALDDSFHEGLLELSGHGKAWSTVQAAKAHLDRARRLGLRLEDQSAARFAAEHRAILAAILAGDRKAARRLLSAHLRAVLADIERVRAASPELFASNPDAVPTRRTVAVWD
ncbi:MAG: GntR family transcriptional regulator [Bifidobacteriaceae bacterium]|nr:GntR family transcriptional regulator [Bifidobacteriaceae bacterium]